MAKEKINIIVNILKERKYLLIFLISAIIYFAIYYLIISYFLGNFLNLFRTYRVNYAYPAFFLNIVISLLIGINISLFVHRLSMLKRLNGKGSLFGSVGLFTGALANGCPGCFVGLFPLFLSLFGITATLSILPFNGIELQGASIALLLISANFLVQKSNICK